MVSHKTKELMVSIHVNDHHTLQNVLVEHVFTENYLLKCLPQEMYKEIASIIYSMLLAEGVEADLEASLLVDEIPKPEIYSPLHYACLLGRGEMVRYICLTKKVDLNRKHSNSEAPIHLAARSNSVETAKNLISNFGLFVNAKDNVKQTAIQLAARKGNVEMVNFLAQLPHISVNNVDIYGETIIHTLARKGKSFSEAFDILLKKPQLEKNIKNFEGETALHIAARKGNSKLVLRLIEAGLDVNARNNVGRNVLQLACVHGHEHVVLALLKNPNVDVNASDMHGNTALHSAAEYCQFPVLKALLMNNVDVAVENHCGEYVSDILDKKNIDHFFDINSFPVRYVRNAIERIAVEKKRKSFFQNVCDEKIWSKKLSYAITQGRFQEINVTQSQIIDL